MIRCFNIQLNISIVIVKDALCRPIGEVNGSSSDVVTTLLCVIVINNANELLVLYFLFSS